MCALVVRRMGHRMFVALLAGCALCCAAVDTKGKPRPPSPSPPCAYRPGCDYPKTHWSTLVPRFWWPATTKITTKEQCCCACKQNWAKASTHMAECAASVFYAGPPAQCWLHTIEDVKAGCLGNSTAVACLNRDPGWPPGPPGPPAPQCPSAPVIPPKPPPAMPCTIAPLPPAPPAPKRWVSWWYDGPSATNASSPGDVAFLAQLKAQGGAKVATSILLGCGDTINATGFFVPGTSR